MAYTLTYSRSPISEGESVVISLNGTGLPNGTLVPFTITGANVSLFDFIGISSLSGNFLIQNDKSKITLKIAEDLNTENTESFILRLTGPGRTENIGITILDTSQTAATVAEFFIKPDRESINEGEVVVFNVTAVNVPIGTSVPYVISGIQDADVFNVPVSGNLIFAANSSYDTTANIRLSLIVDALVEGDENIVLLIYPTFAYSLELNGTTIVKDGTSTASKQLVVVSDNTKVVEGDNITFTVSTTNIEAGSNLSYRIIPWTNWNSPDILFEASDLTSNDFVNLPSFTGTFPPVTAPSANAKTNVTSITFTTKDDFIFEPSEYFYLGVSTDTGLSSGSGIVEIRDSGNTFLRSFSAFSGNAIVTFLESANLTATIGGSTYRQGEWETSDGKVSDVMVMQGRAPFAGESSAIYYQPFSYVIRSSKSIKDWLYSVKNILHPAGFAIFSEINNETTPENMNYADIKTLEDSEINTYSTIGVDSTKRNFNVSNTNITVDTVFVEFNPQ